MVKLLIRDIANTDRNGAGSDPDFSFLRHFSPYTGHSWANGPSRGNVGGQQESTPEAIQAWAAILLWAQLNYPESPENADLERWAAYMFASEVKAARMYWFGFTEDAAFRPHLSFRQYAEKTEQVPKPYLASMVSQIFQSEMTFQTCFGNAPLLKHGIQWLPLTGSSLYLGTSSADAEAMVKGYLENDLPKLANGGTSPSNKDKFLMMEALAPSYRAAPRPWLPSVPAAPPRSTRGRCSGKSRRPPTRTGFSRTPPGGPCTGGSPPCLNTAFPAMRKWGRTTRRPPASRTGKATGSTPPGTPPATPSW